MDFSEEQARAPGGASALVARGGNDGEMEISEQGGLQAGASEVEEAMDDGQPRCRFCSPKEVRAQRRRKKDGGKALPLHKFVAGSASDLNVAGCSVHASWSEMVCGTHANAQRNAALREEKLAALSSAALPLGGAAAPRGETLGGSDQVSDQVSDQGDTTMGIEGSTATAQASGVTGSDAARRMQPPRLTRTVPTIIAPTTAPMVFRGTPAGAAYSPPRQTEVGSRVNFASLDPVAKDERLRNLANLGRVLRKESQNKTNLVNREKAENARLLAENARLQALLVAADARFEDKFNLPSSSADLMRQIASANAVFKKKDCGDRVVEGFVSLAVAAGQPDGFTQIELELFGCTVRNAKQKHVNRFGTMQRAQVQCAKRLQALGARPLEALREATFARRDWLLTDDGERWNMSWSMEDPPHKIKNMCSAVSHAEICTMNNIISYKACLEVASSSEAFKAIKKHLLRRGDAQDTATCKQMFSDKGFLAALRALGTDEAYDTALVLDTIGGWYDIFSKKGLSAERREELSRRFITLYDEVIPRSAWLEGQTPAGNILGVPRRLWFAMRADIDSLALLRACFPTAFFRESYFSTFDLEGAFSDLVRRCGGRKPDLVTAMGAMASCDIMNEIRHMVDRGFGMTYSVRAAYDYAEVSRDVAASSQAVWQGAQKSPYVLPQDDRDRSRLPKGGSAETAAIRSFHVDSSKK